MNLTIRHEQASDVQIISDINRLAFETVEYSSHTEHLIVDALRKRNKLTLSLVALDQNQVVGHVAISPVSLSTGTSGWYGLGPIAVLPNVQHQGVGSALMFEVLAQLKALDAEGCVLLGDPNYYQKFGFKAHPNLVLADVPAEYFQTLSFKGDYPKAEVLYDEAFNVSA